MLIVELSTRHREQMIDVTKRLQQLVAESGVGKGSLIVFCPHTTAAITINENADPAVQLDLLGALDRAVPRNAPYKHLEGNAHAHVKASLMGPSKSVIIEDGKLQLGTWQSVFYCEFDGPRKRQMWVQIQEIRG